jgi:hypothetical protein
MPTNPSFIFVLLRMLVFTTDRTKMSECEVQGGAWENKRDNFQTRRKRRKESREGEKGNKRLMQQKITTVTKGSDRTNGRKAFEICEIMNFLEHTDIYRLLFEYKFQCRRRSGCQVL